MTDAEKVVKALREMAEFHRGMGDASETAEKRASRWDALADFVLAAVERDYTATTACDDPEEEVAFHAALARLREVLGE